MNTLKDIAIKAKNRLLNKGLRESYATLNNYNSSYATLNNNFFEKNKVENNKNKTLLWLVREDKLMRMSNEDRERYILESIRKYQEEKRLENFN